MSVAAVNSLKDLEDLRYPIGRFETPAAISREMVEAAIKVLDEMPERLRRAIEELSGQRIDTPYRPGGWTVRQLVHHVAESHMHAFLRVRLALTEEWPTIKPYDEVACAELQDQRAPVEWSLVLVESLHARWVMMLQRVEGEQWRRGFVHPVNGKTTVEGATLQYAWHAQHHTAHIERLKLRERG